MPVNAYFTFTPTFTSSIILRYVSYKKTDDAIKVVCWKETRTIVKFWSEEVETKHLPVAGLVVVTTDRVASGHQHRTSLVS